MEKKKKKTTGKKRGQSIKSKLDAIEEEAEEEDATLERVREAPQREVNAQGLKELRLLAGNAPQHPFLPHKYGGSLLQTYFKHSAEEAELQGRSKIHSRVN